jgi:hypothetical protein
MSRLITLLFFAVAFAATVSAQALDYVLAAPAAEYMFRRAYAPIDFAIGQAGQYAGYGQNGRTAAVATGAMTGMATGAGLGAMVGRDTRSALIGAGAGAVAGGVLTYAATRGGNNNNNGQRVAAGTSSATYAAANGREVRFADSKPQKPLDCRKPAGKRGRNETACAAAEAEILAAEQRAALAASPWRLYNRSGFVVEVFDGERRLGQMRPNQSWRVLEPASGFRASILQPEFGGGLGEAEARIRPADDFRGWVITAPRVEE